MSEIEAIVAVLKKQLKLQGRTYRDVAHALGLSEPSVKRLFASGRFTLERLVQVGNFLGYSLAELSQEAQNTQPLLQTLTQKQERELMSDSQLLLVAVCALNHWSVTEIVATYRISLPECVKYLLSLDRLRIIDLLPNNRIRLNVARDFDWLPYGPIKQYFQSQGQHEFLKSKFTQEEELLNFVHGMFTEQAMAQMLSEVRRLRQRFAELHEESLAAPLNKRNGAGLLLAMRKWEPAEFAKLRY